MSLKNPSPELIKEAVAAATRALAENPDLEINFGAISSLPNPPTHKKPNIHITNIPLDKKRLRSIKDKKDISIQSKANGNYPDIIPVIQNAYAVCTWSSSSATPAICEGKPLYVKSMCLKGNATSTVEFSVSMYLLISIGVVEPDA